MNELKNNPNRKTARKKKQPKPETSFWTGTPGQYVFSDKVEESIIAIQDTKILRKYLKNIYRGMIREALSKGIYGQFLTEKKVTVGYSGDSLGVKPVQKRILFDFEVRSPEKGILFMD